MTGSILAAAPVFMLPDTEHNANKTAAVFANNFLIVLSLFSKSDGFRLLYSKQISLAFYYNLNINSHNSIILVLIYHIL